MKRAAAGLIDPAQARNPCTITGSCSNNGCTPRSALTTSSGSGSASFWSIQVCASAVAAAWFSPNAITSPASWRNRSKSSWRPGVPAAATARFLAAGAQAVFEYAHATVRDEDYRLVEGLQANLESGARDHLLFGRNEPGLQHRHISWDQAIAGH